MDESFSFHFLHGHFVGLSHFVGLIVMEVIAIIVASSIIIIIYFIKLAKLVVMLTHVKLILIELKLISSIIISSVIITTVTITIVFIFKFVLVTL